MSPAKKKHVDILTVLQKDVLPIMTCQNQLESVCPNASYTRVLAKMAPKALPYLMKYKSAMSGHLSFETLAEMLADDGLRKLLTEALQEYAKLLKSEREAMASCLAQALYQHCDKEAAGSLLAAMRALAALLADQALIKAVLDVNTQASALYAAVTKQVALAQTAKKQGGSCRAKKTKNQRN